VLGVTGGQFRTAAKFADQHALGLRAGDALHLAVASEHGATVHTLDRRLAEAGPALGVPAQLLA
jgi:predicted nucleic acid-binding protein